MVKNLPANAGDVGDPQIMGQEDPLEDETATPSSSFTWRIPWTEEPGRLHSPGVYKESVMTEHTCTHSISPSCLGLSKITL